MIKKQFWIFIICNIIIFLGIMGARKAGVFDEVSEADYVSVAQVEQLVLEGDMEITFQTESALQDISNLIFKFSNCAGHEQGTLRVRIYDDTEEFYLYEVPVTAFEGSDFYLFTNQIPNLEYAHEVNITVEVEQVANGGLILQCAEESYFDTIDCNIQEEGMTEISPIWGGTGNTVQISGDYKKILQIWGIATVIYILMVGAYYLGGKEVLKKKIKNLTKFHYVLLGVFLILCLVMGVVAWRNKDGLTQEQPYEFWTCNAVVELRGVPLQDGEIIQYFTTQYDDLERFILFFDHCSNQSQAEISVALEDKAGNTYYAWSAPLTAISGETFCLTADIETDLAKDKDYFLRINMTGTDENVTLRAVSEQDMHKSLKKLTVNGEELDNTKVYLCQSYIEYSSYLSLWLVVLGVTFLGFVLTIGCSKERCFKVWNIINIPLFAVLGYFCIESLSGNLKYIEKASAGKNMLIILSIFCLLRALFAKKVYYVAVPLVWVSGLTNHYVLDFRGTPFRFSDIKGISTAISVAEGYSFKMTLVVITAVLIAFCMLFMQVAVDIGTKGVSKKESLKTRVVFTVIGLVVLGLVYRKVDITDTNFTSQSEKHGWCYANMSLLKRFAKEKPEGYSDAEVARIVSTIGDIEISKADIVPANLIVIMNESFCDLSIIGELETNQDYMPFIRGLEENTVKGKLHVYTYGGGTYSTEYEFLTGNSNKFMTIESIPYASGVIPEVEPSIAHTLQEQGYHTIAMHPYDAENWHRDEVYPVMGFDEFLSIEDFEGAETIRNYVSDKADYDKIIECYEKKEPGEKLFIFNVTMQNHGGYDANSGVIEKTIQIENIDSDVGETYLSLIRESDKALEYLLSYFEQIEEPTMVVMFGDHMPALSEEFYETLYGKKMEERTNPECSKMYTTNYLIWTNYESDFEQIPDISTNYLGSYVMECAGVELTEYDKFLVACRRKLPVIGPYGVVDCNGKFYNHWEIPQDAVYDYRILQHMRLKDRESQYYNIFSCE